VDVDNQPAVLRRQDDFADERSKTLGGFRSVGSLCVAQRRVQGRHLLSIEGRHFRVEKGRGLSRFGQDTLQLPLSRLELNPFWR